MESKQPFTSLKSQELVASGIPSLDAVLGGGIPSGSLILLKEDKLGLYSDMFLKVFLAQGIVKKDDIIMASCDVCPSKFITTLPQEITDCNISSQKIATSDEPLQIAWRYENNPAITSSIETYKMSHSNQFQFRGHLSEELIKLADIQCWPSKDSSETYEELLQCIHEKLTTNNHINEKISKKNYKNILRIGIHHFGSFFWKDFRRKLPNFLYKLRALVHHSQAVAFITFPYYLIEESEIISRCEQMSDAVLELESFGPDSNPLFNELNGFIKFNKLCTLNSLCPNMNDALDWAFKLNHKKLVIEKMRLPPESGASVQREQDVNVVRSFCGGGQKNISLDF